MADRINRALAFPVVAPGGSALVRVTVRLEEGEDSFRFARHCHAPKDTEDTVNYFREMTARRFWPKHVQSQRSGLRVTFNPEEQRSYVGESYSMLAMLADTLATMRPELFGSDYENGQTELAIVATGTPDGSGALVLNDTHQNVAGLEAKLRAVLADGEEMFGQHKQKLLVVPRQTHEGNEAALLAELKEAGWTVVATSDLAEDIRDGLLAPVGGEAERVPETQGWLTWPKIGAGACVAAALFAVGLFQGRDTPPVPLPLPLTEPVRAASVMEPQEKAEADPAVAPKSAPVIYSGALNIGVQLVRGEKTYDAPVGNPFMPSETVRLIVTHTGDTPAFAMLFRGQVPVKDLALVPGEAVEADFVLRDLTDHNGEVTVSVADCTEVDCAAAKALLKDNADATQRSYPAGDFRAVRANPQSPLKTVLKFEMM